MRPMHSGRRSSRLASLAPQGDGTKQRVSTMSEDFLKNPLSLFDVKGKSAIITGATGAFGAIAAKTLAAAIANVVITANNAEGLKKIAAECEKLGGKAEAVAKRPSSEAN